ncbi:hypothetical protein D3C78_1165540 [compost metagenome]
MKYQKFTVWASFDGGVSAVPFYDVVAVNIESAIQDIKEAYGECDILNYSYYDL